MPSQTKELNNLYQRRHRERMGKEGKKEFDKKRYHNNKEKYLSRSRAWAKANPHKSQASTHQTTIKKLYPVQFSQTDISTAELAIWLQEHRNIPCVFCNNPSTHIDHVVPLSRDGAHQWSNIRLICGICNRAKSSMLDSEFIAWIKSLSIFGTHSELSKESVV